MSRYMHGQVPDGRVASRAGVHNTRFSQSKLNCSICKQPIKPDAAHMSTRIHGQGKMLQQYRMCGRCHAELLRYVAERRECYK